MKNLLLMCGLVFVNNVVAQVNVSLTVKPPYSAQLNDYRHLEHKAIITLVNTSNSSMQVKLGGSLTNESNGLIIYTNNNYRPAVPIALAAKSSITLTANAGAMNFLDQGNVTTNAPDNVKESILSTGWLPEGVYKLCVDAYDYNTGSQLTQTAMQGCAIFNISLAQPPAIISPANGETIPATQTRPVFSWSPPVGNLAGALIRYKLVVVEVLQGQNPNDAIGVARDFRANNPILYKTDLPQQMYVMQPHDLKFQPGHSYAVQVIASDFYSSLAFVNRGASAVVVFNYGMSAPAANNDAKTQEKLSDCEHTLRALRANKVQADNIFNTVVKKRNDLFNDISRGQGNVYSDRAKKILNEYAVAKTGKQAADSLLYQQERTCSDLTWQMNDKKENPVPVYCDLESDLRDSLKKIDSTIAEKKKKIDSLEKVVAAGEKKRRTYADSLKRAKDSVTVADAGLKKAKKYKDLADSVTKRGDTVPGAADITKKLVDAAEKKRKADSVAKSMEEKKRKVDSTVAEDKKKKDVTLPEEIKKLEGDAHRTDSLIKDCEKKKAEEEERWKRRWEETKALEKKREDAKKAESETAKYNNHILRNIYSYECVCSKAEWDSKGIWDWLPDAINKPVSDGLEDAAKTPIPLDALNALLGLYYMVGAMKDPCSPLGCERIAKAVEKSGEINPKTGKPWVGSEKCEEMCAMMKKIKALK